jgi:uncharacterized membrane protein
MSGNLRFEGFEQSTAKKRWWDRLFDWLDRMEEEHEGRFLLLHFPFMVALWIIGAVVSLAIVLFFKYFPHSWEIFVALVGFWLMAGALVLLSTVVQLFREDPKPMLFYGLLGALGVLIYWHPW